MLILFFLNEEFDEILLFIFNIFQDSLSAHSLSHAQIREREMLSTPNVNIALNLTAPCNCARTMCHIYTCQSISSFICTFIITTKSYCLFTKYILYLFTTIDVCYKVLQHNKVEIPHFLV